MLKITKLSDDLALKMFKADGNEVVKGGGGKPDKTGKNLSKFKKLKNKKFKSLTHIRAIGESLFLTSGIKEAFNYLRQAFIKALIF